MGGTSFGRLKGELPDEFAGHPLVQGGVFLALPRALWANILDEVGEAAFAPEMLQLEQAVSESCGDLSHLIGFDRGRKIHCGLFVRGEIAIPGDYSRALGLKPEAGNEFARRGDDRASRSWTIQRAYAAWLLTNSTYVEEQDALLSKWQADFKAKGPPGRALATPNRNAYPFAHAEEGNSEFQSDFTGFYDRWRLERLAAPNVPVPLATQMMGVLVPSMLHAYADFGAFFFVPDTFPAPSRDELRRQLDETLHRDTPEHLTDWMKIVARDNTAKNEIQKLSRILEVQHYWRLLKSRHSDAFKGRKTAFKQALAAYLGSRMSPKPNARTIQRDLSYVEQRLGEGWCDVD